MKNIFKTLTIASLGILVVGCATAPAPIGLDTANRLHRISVISVAAKTFTRQYTGVTVFGNEKEELDISSWNLDEQYEAQISAEVAKLPGITVVKAPYSQAEFSRANNNGEWGGGRPNWSDIETATKNYCATNRLDAVVVVARTKTGDFLAGTNQLFGGAGIYVRGPGARVSVLHLISDVALLDCSTAKPIALRVLANNQNDMPGAIIRSTPLLPLPEEVSRRPIPQWTEEQKQTIKAGLSTLPARTWGPTIRSMFPTDRVGR